MDRSFSQEANCGRDGQGVGSDVGLQEAVPGCVGRCPCALVLQTLASVWLQPRLGREEDATLVPGAKEDLGKKELQEKPRQRIRRRKK